MDDPQFWQRNDGRTFRFNPDQQENPRFGVTLLEDSGATRFFRPDAVIQQLELVVPEDGAAAAVFEKCMRFYTRKTKEKHSTYLASIGAADTSISLRIYNRESRCHKCHHVVNARRHFECDRCRSLICPKCGACIEGTPYSRV